MPAGLAPSLLCERAPGRLVRGDEQESTERPGGSRWPQLVITWSTPPQPGQPDCPCPLTVALGPVRAEPGAWRDLCHMHQSVGMALPSMSGRSQGNLPPGWVLAQPER